MSVCILLVLLLTTYPERVNILITMKLQFTTPPLSWNNFYLGFLLAYFSFFLYAITSSELSRGGSYVSYESFRALESESYRVPGLFSEAGARIATKSIDGKRFYTFIPQDAAMPERNFPCCTLNAWISLMFLTSPSCLLPAFAHLLKAALALKVQLSSISLVQILK